eukprot:CAMPEP_0171324600 /NCGR_PEP_ID=MMETSP0816-20121228/116282_1 /TAXON_ID=420281 /ORGANISM="Proboscia inermis, Strain CCAP1064/1" /LENGTH=317 /DNA_ID=CAMNT_0011823571 /DNA_START=100 /DNA_END=1054 /DNA_ORIENTATION=-
MKAFSISLCIILQMLPSIHSFSYPKVSSSSVRQSLSLGATIDDNRRVFLGKSLASSTAAILAFMPVEEAMAKDIFVPTYDDIKVFYALGVTLDNLATSAGNPDTFSKALEGIVVFNKSPNFYNTFARSFISKSVKNNADGDPRVGKIRLASSQISSLQELLGFFNFFVYHPSNASIHPSFSYPKVSSSSVRQSLSLGATIDDNRRVFLEKSLASSTAAILAFMPVEEAMAKDIFVPTYDDIKVFYALGVTLDNLATSAGNPDTFSKALEGIVVFNKSPNFYNTFARSFISKSVKNNADGDPRVGKIRLVSLYFIGDQ